MRNTLWCALAALGISVGWAGAAAAGGAPPASVIATVARGPASALDGARDFANAIQPGAGGAINDQMLDLGLAKMVGAYAIDGLDGRSPEYLLVVDDRPVSLVLVGKIADDKALTEHAGTATIQRKAGWAILGPKSAVGKVSTWALSALPALPPAAAPTATIYVPALLAKYKAEVTEVRAKMSAQLKAQPNGEMVASMFDGFFSALADTAQVRVTIDASAAMGALDIAMVPRAGSRLGKWVALQHPSDYALLADLPDGPAMMVGAGHLESGPYHAAMLELTSAMYGRLPKDVIPAIDAIMKASTADLAMTMSFAPGKGMSYAQVFGLADRKAADAAFAKVFAMVGQSKTFDMMGIGMTVSALAAPDHDGVALHAYETSYDLSKADPQQRAGMAMMLGGNAMHMVYATFDGFGVSTLSPDGEALAGRTIDAARGKGAHYTPDKEIGEMLTASRARKESLAMVIDFRTFGSLMGLPSTAKLAGGMMFSLGFADQAAHMHFAISSSAVHSFALLAH